jgi:hypothetical protein
MIYFENLASRKIVRLFWNAFESIVDELAPLVPFANNSVSNNSPPRQIKNKLNTMKLKPTLQVKQS